MSISSIRPEKWFESIDSPRVVLRYAPKTRSESDTITSDVVSWSLSPEKEIGSEICEVPSKVPFTYNEILVSFMIAMRCDQFSIFDEPTTSVHEIPSNTENFTTCSGVKILFNDNTKEFSFDNTVNSAEPVV